MPGDGSQADERTIDMSNDTHDYLGWADGGCACSCGRRFDSVQDYEAHTTTSEATR